jgi:hypothetical protein
MYEVFPEQVLPLVAIVVPITEVLAGIGLILNIRGSLFLIAGLLAGFLAILSYGVLNDLTIDCGCSIPWESARHASLKSALLRDLIMFGMVIYLYIWHWVSPYRHNIKLKVIRRRT